MRCASRWSTARRPATTSAWARPSSRTPATSPTSSGTRRASSSGARPATIPADAERRLPDADHLGPAERWLLSRAAATTAAVDEAMAEYAFGEVARLLYEAIWSEYCDWGLELAKVRLADERLTPADREATWWTLVEVLDTYLRLLHPLMPFVTEAIWGALPHRASDPELLIVARWPGSRRARRGGRARGRTLLDLVSEIRNARAAARIAPATGWRRSSTCPSRSGATFEALRPAVERLARARPLRRELTPEALEAATRAGDLTVIVAGGEIEAAVRPGDVATQAADLERERLERELAEAEGWLPPPGTAWRTRLS